MAYAYARDRRPARTPRDSIAAVASYIKPRPLRERGRRTLNSCRHGVTIYTVSELATGAK